MPPFPPQHAITGGMGTPGVLYVMAAIALGLLAFRLLAPRH